MKARSVEQQRLWWVDGSLDEPVRLRAQGGAIKSWDVRQKNWLFRPAPSSEGAVVALQNGVHLLRLRQRRAALLHHPGGPTL
ncbi:SMP-30/gluconolactonase/LRE family protein [Klebsiella pneumoniae]|nr:SMP-30/gluconolactonase/LRE family protein [Klebsiella pneumoniae]